MARPLRIVEPDLWHHVMNRGQGGRDIFLDDEDRERFLGLAAECGRRWDVWTHAYCVMTNHYHLLLHDEGGRLSRAMRHIDGVYTQWFNKKRGSDGALMRGRFRSRVVQREGYLVEVVRYLHLNPVDAGLVERASDYPWSSHRAYLEVGPNDLCQIDTVLELLGLDIGTHAQSFDSFVHERVDANLADQLRSVQWSPILGDQVFVDECRNKVRSSHALHDAEITDGRRLAAIDVEEVIGAAVELFGVTREQLLRGTRGSQNLPRLLTVLLCRRLTPTTLRDLGALFGVKPATIAALAGRAQKFADDDRNVAQKVTKLNRQVACKIRQVKI